MKILEVNSLDLMGKRYNGYDIIEKIGGKEFEIKQAVIEKKSNNNKVVKILKKETYESIHNKFMYYEEPKESIKNILSISTPSLVNLKEYEEADIIHFHMFHNSGMSLYALRKIAKEKKVIISLHDAWFLTGRCVHFYDCNKWKNGCKKCNYLDTFFPLKEDKCHDLWELKRKVFENLDIDLVVSTTWMYNLIKESPILQNIKNIHKIYFGIDKNSFNGITYQEARKKLGIEDGKIVIFHRAQNEFKGTSYVLEALKMMEKDNRITILTCDEKSLLDDVKDKFNIIDLGKLNDEEMITAMNACDIFLMPSISESFGLMAIEAMSCSKPVIIFDNTALPSVTHAPECGYLVKNKDVKELKNAIIELVNNESERKRRGALGKKIVEDEYSNEKYYESIKKLYQEVYKKKKNTTEEIIPQQTENSEQFKYYLNDLTVMLFGSKEKISKDLMYNVDLKDRIKNYKYTYSDLALQELLWNYENKLYKLVDKYNVTIKNNMFKKIEKLIYIIKNNPKLIFEKLKK